MKIDAYCKSVVDKVTTISYEKAKQYLEDEGFTFIDAGCESYVYGRDDLDYVVKIQAFPFTYSGSLKDVPSTEDFAEQVVFKAITGNVIIQIRCETNLDMYEGDGTVRDFIERVEEQYDIGDVHEGNIGILDGRLVVIDWTTDIKERLESSN